MERWTGRVALVTGASSGIGAAIARRLAEHGMIVVGCARNVENIKVMSEELKASKGSLHAMRCDLRKEKDILAMFAEIKAKHGGVDVCVNNAGVAFNEQGILGGDTAQWKEMIDVNVMALAICTREAVKSMRDRKVDDGHIIQVGSVVANDTASVPKYGYWYSATKWMVRAMTDCLRMELRAEKSRIKVSLINPGRTKTEIRKKRFGEEKAAEFHNLHETISVEKCADVLVSVLGTTEEVEIELVNFGPTSGHALQY